MGARGEGRVPDYGLCFGVLLMGIGIDHAVLQQVPETTLPEVLLVARQQVATLAVHGDLQHQAWALGHLGHRQQAK